MKEERNFEFAAMINGGRSSDQCTVLYYKPAKPMLKARQTLRRWLKGEEEWKKNERHGLGRVILKGRRGKDLHNSGCLLFNERTEGKTERAGRGGLWRRYLCFVK